MCSVLCSALCFCLCRSYSCASVSFGAIATVGAIAIFVMTVLGHYLVACSCCYFLWFMQYLCMVLGVPVPVSYYRRLFFMFSRSMSHLRPLLDYSMTDHFSIVLFCYCLTELHCYNFKRKLICLCYFWNATSDAILLLLNSHVE